VAPKRRRQRDWRGSVTKRTPFDTIGWTRYGGFGGRATGAGGNTLELGLVPKREVVQKRRGFLSENFEKDRPRTGKRLGLGTALGISGGGAWGL